MLGEFRKQISESEEGQALVLGALSMLFLALCLITTINIGRAAYEKVKMQNTADAAAYSTAVVVARAYNFVSYANRAQVSHYVAAMQMQSYLSWLWKLYSMAGYIKVIAENLYLFCGRGAFGKNASCIASWISGLSCTILEALGVPIQTLIDQFRTLADQILTAIKYACEAITQIFANMLIPAHTLLNGALYAIQEASLLWARGIVISHSTYASGPTLKNFPELFTAGGGQNTVNALTGVVNTAFNIGSIDGSLDSASSILKLPAVNSSGSNSSNEAAVKKAKVVMSQIANATRHDRRLIARQGVGEGILKTIQFVSSLIVGVADNSDKKGQAKLTDEGPSAMDRDVTRSNHPIYGKNYSKSKFPMGDTLSSADPLRLTLVSAGGLIDWGAILCGLRLLGDLCDHKNVAVVASQERGYRRYYEAQSKSKCIGVRVWGKCVGFMCYWYENRERVVRGHWWGGITPFVKFKPNPDPTDEFGQPSFFYWMAKSNENFENDPYVMDFELSGFSSQRHGRNNVKFDTKLAEETLLGSMHVFSRATVYYHRPGYWREQPNMFNPYWRAKLSPVSQPVVNSFVGAAQGAGVTSPLFSQLTQFITDNILIH